MPTVEGLRALGEALGIDDINLRLADLLEADAARTEARAALDTAMDAYERSRADWSSASRSLDSAVEEAWEGRRPR